MYEVRSNYVYCIKVVLFIMKFYHQALSLGEAKLTATQWMGHVSHTNAQKST